MVNRRTFLRSSLASAALLSLTPVFSKRETEMSPLFAPSSEGKEGAGNSTIKSPVPDDDFHLGMAGYTFNKFDLDTTLAFMQKIDVHYLCIKDFHLPLDANAQQIAAFKAKLAAANVIGYAVGPIYMKDVAAVDKAYAYAQRVGVDLLVGVPGTWGDTAPNREVLDRIEQKVRETNIRLAIHLHGPDMALYPDATSIWEDVKDRDPRMGMCLDIGHNLRYGSDSIRDLKRYAKRVFDIHLKDVTAPTKAGHAIELGRGIIDFPLFIKMLRKVGYKGSVSLEYEKDMNDPFNGIAESVGYFRAVQKTTR